MRRLKDVMLSPRAKAAVKLALVEDLVSVGEVKSSPRRDVTSLALVDAKAVATGEIYSKGTGCVVAGATVAAAVLREVDPLNTWVTKVLSILSRRIFVDSIFTS